VMIGEIRDLETARIAIQASLTGHLVLSTLHTNSAAASITRLIDMGIENYLIASTVKGVLAQRLVRRLCPHCSRPADADPWVHRTPALEALGPPRLKREVGCDACRGSGFIGRTTVSELLAMDERIHRLILESAADSALESAARQSGMTTLYESGMSKAWRGETTISEILRVTRMD